MRSSAGFVLLAFFSDSASAMELKMPLDSASVIDAREDALALEEASRESRLTHDAREPESRTLRCAGGAQLQLDPRTRRRALVLRRDSSWPPRLIRPASRSRTRGTRPHTCRLRVR